jgi:hypothetical protein
MLRALLLSTDVKIRKHTEDSIARRVPGIRQLAQRYNALCTELNSPQGREALAAANPPDPLDIDQLFNPEANQHMWMGQGLEGESQTDPPEYLCNPKVREGINGMLALNRAKEEEERLQAEGSAMVTWLDTQLKKTQMALGACTGSHFICHIFCFHITDVRCLLDAPLHHQLELHEVHLIQLGRQWRNEMEASLNVAVWPKALRLEKAKASQVNDEASDSDDDLGPVPDSVLEVDDRHVFFLEEGDAADKDEVERMISLVDQTEDIA